MSKWSLLWRISSTSDLSNGHLFALGIPAPTSHRYRDHTVRTPQSQGGQARQGYINVTILWDRLDALQLHTLKAIVEAAITGGTLYATVNRNDGSGLQNDFIDVSGQPVPLEFEMIQQTEGIVYENVQLVINDLAVDNDPSNVL